MNSVAFTIGLALAVFALALAILAVVTVRQASADCLLNGVKYATGTTVGPYVCRADGRWSR